MVRIFTRASKTRSSTRFCGANLEDQALVTSFDHAAVKRVGELDPNLALGVLYAARPADGGVCLAQAVGAQVVLPHVAYVRRDDVERAHDAGLAYVPWTTSEAQRVRRADPGWRGRRVQQSPGRRGRARGDRAVKVAWPGALLRSPGVQLFLTSFLALYAELLCIRWMPAHVRFL